MNRTAWCIAAVIACSAGPAWADGFSGDLRFGWIGSETISRTGQVTETDSFRARLRGGWRGEVEEGWTAAVRLAGVFDTDQNADGFWGRPWITGPGGLEPGRITVDELHLEYRTDGPWSARFGRMQVAFPLADMMRKSLDYNDSPNFDVSWTDGVWLQHRGAALVTHLVIHHNHRRGPTRALRSPLAFTDGRSRLGAYLAVGAADQAGPFTQRMVAVGWLPSALKPAGVGQPGREDYLTLSAKTMAEWPLGGNGARFGVGAEVGYAPNTPARSVMGSGTGETGGLAWEGSLNLFGLGGAHNVGLVYARVADGWLVSGDFRPNESLFELRWAWRIDAAWIVDARVRRREELGLPAGTLRARRVDDAYLRATWRF